MQQFSNFQNQTKTMDETNQEQQTEITSETSAAQPEQSAKKRRGPKKKEEKYSLVLRVPEHLMLAFGETAEARKLAAGILEVYSGSGAKRRIARLIEEGANGAVGSMPEWYSEEILKQSVSQDEAWNKAEADRANTKEPGEGEEIVMVNTGEEATHE